VAEQVSTTAPGHSPNEERPDDYHRALAERLPVERIRALSELEEVRGLFHVALEWTAIGGAIWLSEATGARFWMYPIVVAFIGGRQHALFHLAHEATHYHLLRNRRWNDWVGDFFLAWPCLHSIPAYRRRHFGHHRSIGTLDDPHISETYSKNPTDWRFPKTPTSLTGWLLRRLAGLSFPRYLRGFARGFPSAPSRAFLALKTSYYLGLLVAVGVTQGWRVLLLYWVVPLATWTPMIRDLRLAAEHFAIDGAEDLLGSQSRTVLPTFLERVFICSKGTYFHSEHHDYPGVPFYNLRKVHEEMTARPSLERRLHLTHGYWRVLAELGARAGADARQASSS
jgi:fatty acid desaturase